MPEPQPQLVEDQHQLTPMRTAADGMVPGGSSTSSTATSQIGLTPNSEFSSASTQLSSTQSNKSSDVNSSRTPPGLTHGERMEVGTHTILSAGINLFDMEDSSELFRSGEIRQWKRRLDEHGYLLLRDVLPRSKVCEARRCVCQALSQDWKKIDLNDTNSNLSTSTTTTSSSQPDVLAEFNSSPLIRARIGTESASNQSFFNPSTNSSSSKQRCPGLLLTGFRGVTHHPDVLSILEGPELTNIFSQLFQQLELDEQEQQQRGRYSRPPNSNSPANATTSNANSAASSTSTLSSPSTATPSTFETKWVRIHGHQEFTDEHTDYYRFEHWEKRRKTAHGSIRETNSTGVASGEFEIEEDGARHMCTCWIPLGDYPVAHGTLVVGEGTHHLSGYSAGVYDPDSRRELPPDFEAWRDGQLGHGFNPLASSSTAAPSSSSTSSQSATRSGIWRTTHFHPGDIVIFDIRLIHASTKNMTEYFRISMDTRWKPTKEVLSGQKEAFKELKLETQPNPNPTS